MVIGAKQRDGNTEITTFSNAPVPGAYVIGGTSWSPSVSETNRGECVHGCGLVSAWSKEKNDWISRWVYVNARGVLAITSNTETKRSVVLFKRYLQNTGEAQIKTHALAFIRWTTNDGADPTMEMIRQGYYLKYPYDTFQNYRFSNLILLQKDRLHLIINDQRRTAITDLFFLLDSNYSKITKSYEEYYSTVNTVKKTSGSPTRKTFIMKGWDNNNVLMVGTVTLERGAVELGGSMTLAT